MTSTPSRHTLAEHLKEQMHTISKPKADPVFVNYKGKVFNFQLKTVGGPTKPLINVQGQRTKLKKKATDSLRKKKETKPLVTLDAKNPDFETLTNSESNMTLNNSPSAQLIPPPQFIHNKPPLVGYIGHQPKLAETLA
mmetsp:Transcript_6748/g.10847  ORF Transcript_6748/g.10847 Transcript_6748/m.10847 type:complete len:138 (+) Transcript_6748:995-1408(+)